AAAESLVEVTLPRDHPEIPRGAPVYCSSSQAVKQKYHHARPKPGQWHGVKPLQVEITLDHTALRVRAQVDGIEESRNLPGPFAPAQDLAVMEETVRSCFTRLGQSRFSLASLHFENRAGGFVPVSVLNRVRRDVVAA